MRLRPELERDALDAQTQLVAAEAGLENQSVRLHSQHLTQKEQAATVRAEQAATVRADYSRAKPPLSKETVICFSTSAFKLLPGRLLGGFIPELPIFPMPG